MEIREINKEDIKKEFADVIMTVLIMAKKFNVNIEDATRIKMEEIEKRRLE